MRREAFLLLSCILTVISCTSSSEKGLKNYIYRFDKEGQFSSYVILPSTACKECVRKMINQYKCEICLFISPYSEQRKILFHNSNVINVAYDSTNSLNKEAFNEDVILIYSRQKPGIQRISLDNIEEFID